MPPQIRQQPEHDRFLRFAQGINILRSDGTINRADARAWINREYPNAKLVLEDQLAPAPGAEEDRPGIAALPDGGLSLTEPAPEED